MGQTEKNISFLSTEQLFREEVPFPSPKKYKFTFIDLFAGIGGFHLAMEELGGKCVFASEIDPDARRTYEQNFGMTPAGDITKIDAKDIPHHDVLCAGFPCQPFSIAGKKEGFEDKTKGTLFFDIERILQHHHTKYIVLENVRNLVSHDNGNTWKTIYSHLKRIGYRLTPQPLILSPHHFGVPQLRERVVILGIYDPENADNDLHIEFTNLKKKTDCSLDSILEENVSEESYFLSEQEINLIEIWDDFYKGIKETIIGFPLWAEYFTDSPKSINSSFPAWKQSVIAKNIALYQNNKAFIDSWLKKHNYLADFTPTMKKMEWQAGNSITSVWDGIMQRRQSGLRVKCPNCAPALVAIVQIPIVGKYRRRMTVREAARLQSFDDRFIPNPNQYQAYKQFGNAVNVTVIKECAMKLFKYE